MSGIPVWGPWPPDWWIYFQQAVVKTWCWYRSIVPVPVAVQSTRTDLRRMRRLRFFGSLGLIAGFAFVLPAAVVAAQERNVGKENAIVTEKKVTGEVDVIRPHYLTVVYERDTEKGAEYEMVLPIDEDVQFLNKKSLDEFHVGDTVRVTYEETTWMMEEEAYERMERHATAIRFIRPAKTGLRSGE